MKLPSPRLLRIGLVVAASLFLAAPINAQTSGAGLCRFPGDGVSGEPLRYRTQTDGTIIDPNTGLVWEVKNFGTGIHGVNSFFTWSASATLEPDGTAFTVF
jgi:hypothetical protein